MSAVASVVVVSKLDGQSWQAQILREIFGNPFRSMSLERHWLEWNGGAVLRLAQAINDHQSFQDLPILADSLEEAGCSSPPILSHCRISTQHVRGCWVLDLLLGNS
jgi:hypothetical protein